MGSPHVIPGTLMIHLLPESVLVEGVRYCSVTVAESTDRDAVQRELEKLRGSWLLVYWLFNGEERPVAGRYVMTFEGERFTISHRGGLIERGRIEGLHPDKRPKPYEYAPAEVNGVPRTIRYPGIYLLEGDLFLACIGYDGVRPKVLSSCGGEKTELVVYTRLGE
jgi:uncharacterized protein (TIGR03067 family)